ncbi:MAG: hypothetical protein ACJ75S_02850 [Solirubrobacterales bacterium]
MPEDHPKPCDTPLSKFGQSLDWNALAMLLAHPTKALIIEAMGWIDRPLSASDLALVFDGALGLSVVSYHVTTLAGYGILTKVEKQQVRGAWKSLYVFSAAVRP